MATQFSADALRIVEDLGGTAIAVYHDQKALRAFCRPHVFTEGKNWPRFSPPKRERDLLYYNDEAKRGYLVPRILRIFQALPGYNWQYIVRRTQFLRTPHLSVSTAWNK